MGFHEMLNHRCDIYHIIRTDVSPGYGLQASPTFSYPKEPDLAGVQCHFGVKNGSGRVVQAQPNATFEARVKLTLPLDMDIRVNDKIVDCATGYDYTAEIPQRIRDHHMIVWLRRTEGQASL